jgi:hypothetical protein
MSDNRKILRTLKNMPQFHMDSETKNMMLKNIKEQNTGIEKKYKNTRLIGRICAGAAAFALAAVLLLAVFTPEGNEFFGRLWNNISGQGQNLAQDDNGIKNSAPGTPTRIQIQAKIFPDRILHPSRWQMKLMDGPQPQAI